MANYSTLKAAVADVVKTNGTQAITGANLQAVLLSIINSVGGGGYIFKGVATPSTDAGTPDENVFYIGGAGTYANFGTSVTVPVGSICVFKYNGSWTKEQIALFDGIDDAPTAGSDNLVKSGGVHTELYDESIEALTFNPDTDRINTSYISQNGNIIGNANTYRVYYYACNKGDKFIITLNASSSTTVARLFAVYSGNTAADFSSETAIEVSEAKLNDNGTYNVRILDDRAKYIAIGFLLSEPNAVSVAKAVYTSKFDTIEEDMINSKLWAPNGNVIYDSNEIPVSCDIKWADGTEGTLSYSNFNSDVFEYTTLTATYKSKTIIYELTYDFNGYITNETINIQ